MPNEPRICIFISTYGDGGVERMVVNLARGFSEQGVAVDFMLYPADGPYLDTLPAAVRRLPLKSDRAAEAGRELADYLVSERPAVVLTAKEEDGYLAVAARDQTGGPARVALITGTTISRKMAGRNPIIRWQAYRSIRRLCARLDHVIAVSAGVARDLAAVARLPLERIQVLPNPSVTPELATLAAQTPAHPWFGDGGDPIVVAAGRLGRAKDFPTLVRAFARLCETRPARLMILGEGRQRSRLERLAAGLGVADRLALPGFVDNPYAFMAHADLFVLSSVWEGSPNVLIEALAAGVPVVATDCESGPREILDGGRYGPLVPVGDVDALARAMAATLAAPPDRESLRAGAAPYTLEASARAYLDALGLTPGAPDTPHAATDS
jgi:glycosyltransferase involved in cell wall biosynthesis